MALGNIEKKVKVGHPKGSSNLNQIQFPKCKDKIVQDRKNYILDMHKNDLSEKYSMRLRRNSSPDFFS